MIITITSIIMIITIVLLTLLLLLLSVILFSSRRAPHRVGGRGRLQLDLRGYVISIYLSLYIYVYVYIYTYLQLCICICICVCVCMCVYIYIYVCIHTPSYSIMSYLIVLVLLFPRRIVGPRYLREYPLTFGGRYSIV